MLPLVLAVQVALAALLPLVRLAPLTVSVGKIVNEVLVARVTVNVPLLPLTVMLPVPMPVSAERAV